MNYLWSFSLLLLIGCSQDSVKNSVTESTWLIPKSQVFDGGPGKDGIPALSNPEFINISSATYLKDDDLVVLFKNNQGIHVYPHRILDWHEIVNDELGDDALAVSYCPLTGSAIALNRYIDGGSGLKKTTFGVSGLLYNSNLILYDRLTESYWSQMQNRCVGGPLTGNLPENKNIVETTYKTANEHFPEAQILSDNTGIYGASRYQTYPYGSYRTNDNYLIFPVDNDDSTFPRKQRVLGAVVNGQAKAYRFENLHPGSSLFTDNLAGKTLIVFGNKEKNFLVVYMAELESGKVPESFGNISADQMTFQDNLGNVYNIFGEIIDGPDAGDRLQTIHSYMAFWFAWAAFYPETEF